MKKKLPKIKTNMPSGVNRRVPPREPWWVLIAFDVDLGSWTYFQPNTEQGANEMSERLSTRFMHRRIAFIPGEP